MMLTSLIRLSVLAVFSLALLAGAREKRTTLRGWVSDESCGALHTKPGREDCVVKCRRGGASIGHPEWLPQRLVLVSDRDKKIWLAENPESLDGHEGKHVEVTGTLNGTKKSLRIQRVAEIPNSPKNRKHRARRNPCHMAE